MALWSGTITEEDTSPTLSGVKMVMFAPDGDGIYWTKSEYVSYAPLTTNWDISAIGTEVDKQDATNLADSVSIAFNSDGTVLFSLKSDATVRKFTLSTAYDISTLTYSTSYSVLVSGAQVASDFIFGDSGKIIYVVRDVTVLRYNLSTAWDVSTAADSGDSLDAGADVRGIAMKSDGTQMFTQYQTTGHLYNFGTAWDISDETAEATVTFASAALCLSSSSDDAMLLLTRNDDEGIAKSTSYSLSTIPPYHDAIHIKRIQSFNPFPIMGGV